MIEQACALTYAGVYLLPVLWRNDERKKIQRPGALRAVGIGVHVVGDAVVANLPLKVGGAATQVVKTFAAEKVEKSGPGLGQRCGRRFSLLALCWFGRCGGRFCTCKEKP